MELHTTTLTCAIRAQLDANDRFWIPRGIDLDKLIDLLANEARTNWPADFAPGHARKAQVEVLADAIVDGLAAGETCAHRIFMLYAQ